LRHSPKHNFVPTALPRYRRLSQVCLIGVPPFMPSPRKIPKSQIFVVLADTTDNKFIEAAITGRTDCIVSGDKHLLDLKEYKSIPIITAREFIDILEIS
ncbi:MAG: PIN domain-containing protein, partial [Chloroflexota bacterium]